MEVLLFWIICGIIAGVIGSQKDAGCLGFFWGVLLGPLGIIVAIVMKGAQINCPYCKKLINPKALKCPYCQTELGNTIEPEEKIEFITCPNCQAEHQIKNKFCSNCGKKLIIQ